MTSKDVPSRLLDGRVSRSSDRLRVIKPLKCPSGVLAASQRLFVRPPILENGSALEPMLRPNAATYKQKLMVLQHRSFLASD